MNEYSVVANGISFSYGRGQVFSDFDLRLPAGVTGLLGPNGAGKTTLLNLIATLTKPHGGVLEVLGFKSVDRKGQREIRRRIGFVPQRFGMIGSFTAQESVEYAAWLHGVAASDCARRAADALNLVDLIDRADTKVRKLSGGMRQRLGIAQAIAHRPELLILDEPTAGLDPVQRMGFRDMLRRAGERGSVIISSHLADDIERACDQVVVLRKGESVFTGTPSQLAEIGTVRGDMESLGSALERGYAALVIEPKVEA